MQERSILREFDKNNKIKQIGILFDVARAFMYLMIAGMMFFGNYFRSIDAGQLSFIKAFATMAGIYGLFRLWRAIYTFHQYLQLQKNRKNELLNETTYED